MSSSGVKGLKKIFSVSAFNFDAGSCASEQKPSDLLETSRGRTNHPESFKYSLLQFVEVAQTVDFRRPQR